jgi:integrase/recombinase XerC
MSPDLESAVSTYLHELGQTGRLSTATIQTYRQSLENLGAFLTGVGIGRWEGLEADILRRWLAARTRSGTSPRTLARDLSAVRSLYRDLIRKGVTTGNPALLVRPPKNRRRLPVILDVDRMGQLFTRTPRTIGDHLDRAVLELLYSSALRLSELVGLDMTDLNAESGLIRVRGKGNRERVVPIGSPALQALAAWLRVRPTRDPRERALFVSREGSRIAPRTIQARLARYGLREGIGARLHPHLFRHSCASHLLESSGNLRGVQEFLGHQHLATTQIYTHLDFQHLAQVYDETHPRARRQKTAPVKEKR